MGQNQGVEGKGGSGTDKGEGLPKHQCFQLFFENAQRGSRANVRREVIPEARSHRREGPISCLFFLGLPRRQAPQPHLLARRVIWVDLGGSRRSARYGGPKPFRALYVSINTLKLMRKRMGSQCNAARVGETCWYFFTPLRSLAKDATYCGIILLLQNFN